MPKHLVDQCETDAFAIFQLACSVGAIDADLLNKEIIRSSTQNELALLEDVANSLPGLDVAKHVSDDAAAAINRLKIQLHQIPKSSPGYSICHIS